MSQVPQTPVQAAAEPGLDELYLEHVKTAHDALDKGNALLEEARAELTKQAQAKTAAEAWIPQVVDALVQHSRITPGNREKAAAMLRDPVQVMQILFRTADPGFGVKAAGAPATQPAAAAPARPVGAPAPAKTAGAPAQSGPDYPGQRSPYESPADRQFRTGLLGMFGR
jgi:hypothetical protein